MEAASNNFELSEKQKALYIELKKLDSLLGQMYLGALMVLSQSTNPDRFALASHGLRELMEKLPNYLNVPTKKGHNQLYEKVTNLASSWKQVTGQKVKTGQSDIGINPHTKTFNNNLKEFFDWFKDYFPTRKTIASQLLVAFDPLGYPLPIPIEKLRIQEWQEFDRTFQKLSHHNSETDEKKYFQCVSAFEKFLLDQLRPRTFEDHSDIDKVIQEGEGL